MALTNQRFQVKSYPTPLSEDIVFYEEIESKAPEHQNFQYGQPHWDSVRYPNHVLVFVRRTRDKGGPQEWYYAAPRSLQDNYNYQFADADIGSTKFKTVERTYVMLREDFSPTSIDMGASMSSDPDNKFTDDYVLASRRELDTPDETLKSIFVVEQHTYVKKVPFIDIEINKETGEAQQVITTLYYRGEAFGGSTIEALTQAPDNDFWNLDANGFGYSVNQLSDNWWAVTQRQMINLEDIWEWELDRRGPIKFYCPADETKTTWTSTNNEPGPLSPLPIVPVGTMVSIIKWGGYMRYTTSSRNIDNLEVIDELRYMPDDGYAYPVEIELIENNEVPETRQAITAEGIITEYQGVEGCLAVSETKQAISLENETQDVSSFLRPDKYIPGVNTISSLIETATDGSLTFSAAVEGEQIKFESKGNISKLTTTTQEGDLIPLAGAQVNPQDGIAYDTLEEAVPYAQVTQTDMDASGNVTEYAPIDGNFAKKVTANALSTEPETKVVASRLPPDKFFIGGGKPETITTITVGDLPPTPTDAAIDEQVQYDSKGRITRESITTITGEPIALPVTSFDERTGIGYLETQELVPIGEVVETDVDATGAVDIYESISPDYAIKTTKRVASTESKTWVDIINYEWPPVLTHLYFKTYRKRNGTILVVPVVKFKEGFNGPQKVDVTQYWQKTPIEPISPTQMIPEGFRFQCMYYTIDVPPCLHDEVDFLVSTGTNDPVWEFIAETESFEATNFIDWPDSIGWRESKPFRGGYLVTDWIINKPS